MIGITDPTIPSFENCAGQNFHKATPSNNRPPTATFLHSPEPTLQEVLANNGLDGSFSTGTTSSGITTLCNAPPTSSIKHEPQESELIKLLKKTKASAEGQPKPATYLPAIQPLLPEPTQTVVLPTTATTTKIPIQPVLQPVPAQAQKLVISSQQPSTVQICPIYPRPLEDNKSPQALLAIPG